MQDNRLPALTILIRLGYDASLTSEIYSHIRRSDAVSEAIGPGQNNHDNYSSTTRLVTHHLNHGRRPR